MPTSHQKKWANDVKFEADVEFTTNPVGLNASASTVSVINFNGVLTSSETDVQKALDKLDNHTHVYSIPYYRIGDIIESTNSVNPGETVANGGYGYGTWSQIAGGRVLIGQTGSDTDFDTAEETGGSKTFNNEHSHTISAVPAYSQPIGMGYPMWSPTTGNAGSTTQSIMNPYFVVYIWQRTA